MLKIKIISVGDKMPAWVNEGTTSYLKRIQRNTEADLIQINAKKRGKQVNIKRVLLEEGEAILKQLTSNTHLICLDRKGKTHDSLSFADKIRDWQRVGQNTAFIIGGPEGLDSAVLARANETWALSKMTFSHYVARVMLAEQLYRAWSITEGLPYHR